MTDRSLTRREAIASALAFSLWPTLHSNAVSPPLDNSAGRPDDEPFWSDVRSRFEWEPSSTNLFSVVRGIAPKAIRENAELNATRLNSVRPSGLVPANWKEELRKKTAAFIGAQTDSVAILRNTTEGVTTVLSNWPLKRGDEILTSSAEHGPFYDTLAQRAARDGVAIRRFHYPAPATSLESIVDAVERAMTPRTRLVMIGQVVLFGQINPVRAIADQVHARGAKLLVDGVLAVGHVPADVRAMDCDFYAAGFHKFACGPRATAVFYVRPGLVEQLPSLFGRFTTDEHGVGHPQFNSGEMGKYETFGAHPEGQFLALGNSLDFLSRIGIGRIQARLYYLTSRWMSRVQSVPGFRAAVTLDPSHCAGLVGFELAGKKAELRAALNQRQIIVGGTENYTGFFRIPDSESRSLFCPNVGIFTSPAEVDKLADVIESTLRT